MKTIVTEHRATHGARPAFRVVPPVRVVADAISPPFKPFAPGTVRGPYRTTHGAESHVQFLVQTRNGWVPFVRDGKHETEARECAEAFAKQHLAP